MSRYEHPVAGPYDQTVYVERVRNGLVEAGRCAVLLGLSAVKLVATALPALLPLPNLVGVLGLTVMLTIPGSRLLAFVTRRLLGHWENVPIPSPYLPLPALERTENGWYWNGYDFHRRRTIALFQRRLRWVFIDPATWRDVAWMVLDPVLALLVAFPVALILGGVYTAAMALTGRPVIWLSGLSTAPPAAALVTAAALIVLGTTCAPTMSAAYRTLLRLCVAPSERTVLTRRVGQLFTTRVEVLTAQAAELRRIERDLHDGAQARLVAIGMAVRTAELLFTANPEQAMRQLAKARELSGLALHELREVVHNIHPPVLAERGLGDAVKELASDAPLAVTVDADLDGRLDAAVESAAYFSVAELLTNSAKYADADTVAISIGYRSGSLRITVTDDGRGGADPARGTGLRGVERRLHAFDGALDLSSPEGGPTRVALTLPCAPPLRAAHTADPARDGAPGPGTTRAE